MRPTPILYIKRGCPWCQDAVGFFAKHGVTLDLRDVNQNSNDLHRLFKLTGKTLTPTLEYGEFVVPDFSVAELLTALEKRPDVRAELGLTADVSA